MTDIDDRLRDYAQRWRAAQPPPPSQVPVGGRPGRGARRFGHPKRLAAVAAAAVVVGGVAAVAATRHHGPTRVTTANPSAPPPVRPYTVRIVSRLELQDTQVAGTGIVLSSTGEVLTTNDVIDGATSIEVTDPADGRTYTARVAGYDTAADVAVLQMTGASGLGTAPIGDPATLSAGQPVAALRTSARRTVAGTVTASNRSVTVTDGANGSSRHLSGMIEADLLSRPGDAGAPLDAAGRVIGIDTASPALLTTTPSHSLPGQATLANPPHDTNPSYAIPIDRAVAVAASIEAGRSSSEVHVGTTAFLGVEVSAQAPRATVAGVVAGSPAAAAGLAAGDVITALGGRPVASAGALTAQLGRYRAGDRVALTWGDRHGGSHTATVDLSAGPAR